MADKFTLLKLENVRKAFPVRSSGILGKKDYLYAVNGVSFEIDDGQIFGLAGESGCGKTTIAHCILRLIEPTGGSIKFMGENILGLKENRMREIRRHMQTIFQDPFSSLNPRMKIKQILSEPLKTHKVANGRQLESIIENLLEKVGLGKEAISRYPHEFSGGQRQRIGIARAIASNPKLIIADEPVSALDVSVRAQIINLLIELHQKLGLSYLLISHDLNLLMHLCNRIAIMYLGKIVELGSSVQIYQNACHPYTKALFSAVPKIESKEQKKKIILSGDIPSAINLPKGCLFYSRCKKRKTVCQERSPGLIEIEKGHFVACHYPSS